MVKRDGIVSSIIICLSMISYQIVPIFRDRFFTKNVSDYKNFIINPIAMKIESKITWGMKMRLLCSLLKTINF